MAASSAKAQPIIMPHCNFTPSEGGVAVDTSPEQYGKATAIAVPRSVAERK
jgi:hypothetical protein